MTTSRFAKWVLLGSLVLGGTGCGELFHNLQMHRLHRLNRVPDMMSGNGYNFSIPSPPLPESATIDDEELLSRSKEN